MTPGEIALAIIGLLTLAVVVAELCLSQQARSAQVQVIPSIEERTLVQKPEEGATKGMALIVDLKALTPVPVLVTGVFLRARGISIPLHSIQARPIEGQLFGPYLDSYSWTRLFVSGKVLADFLRREKAKPSYTATIAVETDRGKTFRSKPKRMTLDELEPPPRPDK